MNAIHSRHARVHSALTVELGIALKAMQSALLLYTAPFTALSAESMPEPDIAVADPDDARILPGEAVRLAIKISDATLDTDLGRKMGLYASNDIPK